MYEDQNSVLGKAVFEEKPLPINDRDAKFEQLDSQMAEITNRIDTLENSGIDAEAREDITEINELLGDNELETEAQTITGAINELKSSETDPVTVNDTLTSTSATEALSAKQGKILNDELNAHKAENANKHIKESGSNANGRYIKFDDGTMICTMTLDITYTHPTVFYSQPILYPATFISEPILNISSYLVSASGWPERVVASCFRFTANNTTACIPTVLINTAHAEHTSIHCMITAIGRWKA